MYGNNRFGGDAPKPVNVGEEIDVTIEAVGEKGDGVAKKDGFVLFVPGAKEGQRLKVRVTKVLRKVGFAEIVGDAETSAKEESPVSAPEPAEPAPEDSENFGEEPAEPQEEASEDAFEEADEEQPAEEPAEESEEPKEEEPEQPSEEDTEEPEAETADDEEEKKE